MLQPRDCLYGGRTECTALDVSFTAAEWMQYGYELRYYDIVSIPTFVQPSTLLHLFILQCSLYPYTMTSPTSWFPEGHHRKLKGPGLSTQVDAYFGLMSAVVLPNQYLRQGFLPIRDEDGAISFPLCSACSRANDHFKRCDHNVNERLLHGNWTSVELYFAVTKGGYRIMRVDQVGILHHRRRRYRSYRNYYFLQVWQYDSQSNEIFTRYFQALIPQKVEASEPPPIERMQEFLDGYAELGIKINPANIRDQPGRRYIMKLLLNR